MVFCVAFDPSPNDSGPHFLYISDPQSTRYTFIVRSTDIVCLSEEHLLVSSGPPDFPFGQIHALAQVPASFNLTSLSLRIFVVNELHLDRPCVDEQVSA